MPLAKVLQEMTIIYGSDDIGVTHPFGGMAAYSNRLDKIKNGNTHLAVINDASHSFRGYETQLASIVGDFLAS